MDIPIDWNLVDSDVKELSFKGQKKQAKVVSVYDGDTIQLVFPLQGELFRWTCRLSGVDTPEIRTRNKTEKKFGYDVRNYLREKIQIMVILLQIMDQLEQLLEWEIKYNDYLLLLKKVFKLMMKLLEIH